MYEQNFENQDLQCVECGKIFEFPADDQEFYAQKGYSTPKRCPECRENRKRNSNNNSRGGGGGNKFRERKEYSVVCAACGCETTVPFMPKDDRPVFCADCYRKQQY